jgi:hypothetical protein
MRHERQIGRCPRYCCHADQHLPLISKRVKKECGLYAKNAHPRQLCYETNRTK